MKPSTRAAVPRKFSHDDRPEADDLAADILAFLAEDESRILRFFDLTGLTPGTLREAAERPDFSTSIIDYLAADDRLFVAFATARGHDPAHIEAIRTALAPRFDEDA